jgi:hypothetical protein
VLNILLLAAAVEAGQEVELEVVLAQEALELHRHFQLRPEQLIQ